MGRLTKRNSDGSVGINEFRYYNYDDFQKLAQKLAHYEDLEEAGRLITLPCAVGDTVWMVCRDYNWKGCKYRYVKKTILDHFMIPSINRTVFLTKEEAEKELQELQNE